MSVDFGTGFYWIENWRLASTCVRCLAFFSVGPGTTPWVLEPDISVQHQNPVSRTRPQGLIPNLGVQYQI